MQRVKTISQGCNSSGNVNGVIRFFSSCLMRPPRPLLLPRLRLDSGVKERSRALSLNERTDGRLRRRWGRGGTRAKASCRCFLKEIHACFLFFFFFFFFSRCDHRQKGHSHVHGPVNWAGCREQVERVSFTRAIERERRDGGVGTKQEERAPVRRAFFSFRSLHHHLDTTISLKLSPVCRQTTAGITSKHK